MRRLVTVWSCNLFANTNRLNHLEIKNKTKTKWKEIITKSVAKPAVDGTNKLSTECFCNLFRNKNRLNHYL